MSRHVFITQAREHRNKFLIGLWSLGNIYVDSPDFVHSTDILTSEQLSGLERKLKDERI